MIRKVLVVEDEPSVREAVSFILENNGYEVATAANGEVGLEMLRGTKPDLVICDIMMPVLGGYEFIEAARESPDTADVPVIFLTAKGTDADIKRGYGHGVDYYLTKPFTQRQLLAGVRHMDETENA